MKGFSAVPLIVVLVVVGVVSFFGYKFFLNKEATYSFVNVSSATPVPTDTSTASPSATPKPTIKPTPKIVATATPTPTVTPTPTPTSIPTQAPGAPKTGCALYNLGGDLGSLKVTIQPESGKQLVGDAGITIDRKYRECLGVDPGFPVIQIIKQGDASTTFSGMRPGPFHIEVGYHGHNDGYDVNINSGDNSTTVTVHD